MAIDPFAPILVEIEPRAGVRQVSLKTEILQEESAKAIDGAMNTIYNTATRINNTIEALEVKPSQVEIDFGIKIVAETGAIITKVGGEANFNIKIIWSAKQ
jgi:hypothetical protein